MYEMLEQSVDEQLQNAPQQQAKPQRNPGGFSGRAQTTPKHSQQGPSNYRRDGNGGNRGNWGQGSNGNKRGNGMASQAQIKAIFAIGRDRGVNRDDLVQILQGEFGVDRPDDLGVGQASELIGMLQGMERVRR